MALVNVHVGDVNDAENCAVQPVGTLEHAVVMPHMLAQPASRPELDPVVRVGDERPDVAERDLEECKNLAVAQFVVSTVVSIVVSLVVTYTSSNLKAAQTPEVALLACESWRSSKYSSKASKYSSTYSSRQTPRRSAVWHAIRLPPLLRRSILPSS